MEALENDMHIQKLKQDINAILSTIDTSGPFVSEHETNMLVQEIKKRGYTKHYLCSISGGEIVACHSCVDTNWDYGRVIQEMIEQYDEPAITLSHEQERESWFYTKRISTILYTIDFSNASARKMAGIEYVVSFMKEYRYLYGMEQYRYCYGNEQGDLLKTRDYIANKLSPPIYRYYRR